MDNLWQKVENIVAKGEIARFVQFLLLSLFSKKPSVAKASESVYMRERVKPLIFMFNPFLHTDAPDTSAADEFWKYLFQKEKLLII